jgi:uncharacterized DUF497 family protein
MKIMNWQAPNEWDPAKAKANLLKHKVPFPMACEVFKDGNKLERVDASSDYGEERWIVLGSVEQKILSVVYTQRGQHICLISARRATHDEQRTYWTGEIPS